MQDILREIATESYSHGPRFGNPSQFDSPRSDPLLLEPARKVAKVSRGTEDEESFRARTWGISEVNGRPPMVFPVRVTSPCPGATCECNRSQRLTVARPPPDSVHLASKQIPMGRWPDDRRSTLVTALLIFVLFPALCWLTWWFVRG